MKTQNALGDIIEESVHDPDAEAKARKASYIDQCLTLMEKMIRRPLTLQEREFDGESCWRFERDATCVEQSPLYLLQHMNQTGFRHCITFPPPVLTDAERAAVAPLPVLNPVIASTITEAIAAPDSPSAAAIAAASLSTWWRLLRPSFRQYLRSFGFTVTWNWRHFGWVIEFSSTHT